GGGARGGVRGAGAVGSGTPSPSASQEETEVEGSTPVVTGPVWVAPPVALDCWGSVPARAPLCRLCLPATGASPPVVPAAAGLTRWGGAVAGGGGGGDGGRRVGTAPCGLRRGP